MISVITNIGFDHMQMLGDTLPLIASEKAGIIKPNIPVIIGEWQKETAPVFKAKALHEKAPVYFASRHLFTDQVSAGLKKTSYTVRTSKDIWFDKLNTDLTGAYQKRNLATVLEAIYRWNLFYQDQYIDDHHIKKALSDVKSVTMMIGRWMIIREKPLVIADAAHNHHGMKAMLPGLLELKVAFRHFVLGFVADKDITKLLGLFPKDSYYYWCAPGIPRAKPVEETRQTGSQLGLEGETHQSVIKAFHSALKKAGQGDLIFVGGSSYVVGDFIADLDPESI